MFEKNISVEKLESKRPLERIRHKWEENIKINLGEISGRPLTVFIWLTAGSCK